MAVELILKHIKDIISNIKDKYSLSGLIAILLGFILYFLLNEHSQKHIPISIQIMAGIIFIIGMITIVKIFKNNQGRKPNPTEYKYDFFISTPIEDLIKKGNFIKRKLELNQLVSSLRKYNKKNYSVFFAGEDIISKKDFLDTAVTAKRNIQALEDSKYYLLIYPEKIASSVLWEAGLAFALKKKSIYFVDKVNDLPFLLRNLSNVCNKIIRIYSEKSNIENILTFINNNDITEAIWSQIHDEHSNEKNLEPELEHTSK